MLDKQALEHALVATLEDAKLSTSEKHALREVFSGFESDAETLNYIRNRAFDLAGKQMREDPANVSLPLKWLEQMVKTIDTVRHVHPVLPSSVHFSPGNACADRIIGLLKNARKPSMFVFLPYRMTALAKRFRQHTIVVLWFGLLPIMTSPAIVVVISATWLNRGLRCVWIPVLIICTTSSRSLIGISW